MWPGVGYTTIEDMDLNYIDALKGHLREYPLLPDVDSGQKLPMCHCSFKGCVATTSEYDRPSHWGSETWLVDHLKACHAHLEMAEISQNCCQGEQHKAEMTLLAYYMAAVRAREREHSVR